MDKNIRIPKIPVNINESNINKGALQILSVIRPDWNKNSIQFKLLTDGITNKLVACKLNDADASETVLVRVYGHKTDLLIDRNAETRNILLLSQLGLAPSLYATFENGLAYQYVPGQTLTDKTVQQKSIYTLIAVQMAKLHKVQIKTESKPNEPFIWKKIQAFLDIVPDVFTDSSKHQAFQELGISKANLEVEIEFLKRHLSDLGSPIVFCHNDLLLGNVIYTEDNNYITFIDYEYAAFNYQAFDIANHFLEFAGVENPDFNKYPSVEMQYDWFRIYLTEFQANFTQKDVDNLYDDVSRFTALSHLFWTIWALIQTEHSYIEFDFLGYAGLRYNQYLSKKRLVEKNK